MTLQKHVIIPTKLQKTCLQDIHIKGKLLYKLLFIVYFLYQSNLMFKEIQTKSYQLKQSSVQGLNLNFLRAGMCYANKILEVNIGRVFSCWCFIVDFCRFCCNFSDSLLYCFN